MPWFQQAMKKSDTGLNSFLKIEVPRGNYLPNKSKVLFKGALVNTAVPGVFARDGGAKALPG